MKSAITPYLAEYLGTFFFILVIFASGGNALAIGAALAAVIYLVSAHSGAHVNPAVSIVMHMNGIHPTMQGEVRISGELVDSKNKDSLKAIRSKVGIVFQDPDDQLFMPTVGEDVAFGPYNMGLRGDALNKVVADALTQVGMLDFIDRPPHHLSFGQRRRVAVATVLAMKPEILVLDEPSSNLDPASRRELADILRSLDITIVMVTHDLPYAFELCERSVILSGGIIVADDKTGKILNDENLLKSHRLELPVGFSFN